MGKAKDLAGKRYGRLIVIGFAGRNKRSEALWLCRCDCGNETVVISDSLKSGKTKSCGCLQRQIATSSSTKHGLSNSRIYGIWNGMIQRCGNQKRNSYKEYGGKGVLVCDEWRSFPNFYDWAIANGYSDDLTLDRIETNGNYCPENCRWATAKEQANNRSTNLLVEAFGETHTIAEWCDKLSLKRATVYKRLRCGWSAEMALTKEVGRNGRSKVDKDMYRHF